ncbi:hypothetical protein [Allocoleopsis sp.]|uniref:hypothetical protein n=1 Tax=Allocoleopsis sp. TaxID=3088169 RepID=UPI002FD65BF2
MNEELEKKIGKIVISIFQAFLKIVYFYLQLLFIAVTLLFIFFAFTLIIGVFCLVIEAITGIDTTSFRGDYLTLPMRGLIWILDKVFLVAFEFLFTNSIGFLIFIAIISVIAIFEYKKRIKT